MTVGELKPGDFIAVPRSLPDFGRPHKLPPLRVGGHHLEHPVRDATHTTVDLMWLLGLLVGDGNIQDAGKTHRVQLAIPATDVALRAEIAGQPAQRAELLAAARLQAPQFAPAHWHSGYLRSGKAWATIEEAQRRAAADKRLDDYSLQRATAAEIRAEMADSPSDSSVRTLLRLMEDKGHLAHEVDGPRYVYFATLPQDAASRRALQHVIRTFFGGSAGRLVSALLDDELLDDDALDALAQLVDDKRKENR